MKKLLVVLLMAAGFAACQSADTNTISAEERKKILKDSANYTTIEWIDSISQDLGKAKEGDQVKISYRFRNSGEHDLYILDATAECGCTTPEKPAGPIAPGKEGVIKAKFNSSNRPGTNNKHIFVTANTPLPNNQTTLEFRV